MRSVLFCAVLLPALLSPAAPAGTTGGPARPPNVVVILADDLGFAELGVQGCRDIPTPSIDSIARSGVLFTQGYVSCPVCSPTRAGLLTGRYQQRFGHEFNPGPEDAADADFGLPLAETTLAERLRALGYATGMVGKWHLGYNREYQPMSRGFQEFFGFLGGAHPYLPDRSGRETRIRRGYEPVVEREYLTDAFAREATAFIDRHAGEPFFLYLAFNAVHAPLQATEKYLSRFREIEDEKRRTFAAMLSAMDDAVGAVLGKLREKGIEENTLVFFLSDNGGPTRQTTSANTPFRGFKAQVFEGGIRVPFCVQWKAAIPAGRVLEAPAISLDILPTAVAAAGGILPPDAGIDGVNLLPWLKGERRDPPHAALFWRMGSKQQAVLSGALKLVASDTDAPMLYDLAADPMESADLAASRPNDARSLRALFNGWSSKMGDPRWARQGGARRGAK